MKRCMIPKEGHKGVNMTDFNRHDLQLKAHLMRRAGFGASLEEVNNLADLSYDRIVEQLVYPDHSSWMGEHMTRRFDNEASGMINPGGSGRRWLYRMITSNTPLVEKMPLFWHGIFATGVPKVINGRVLSDQIDMFRNNGMGRFDDILLSLARNPAMIVWLDNQDNHKDSINENWGRELLELFSMGVGNYSENDIKECARAFTGWSIGNSDYMMVRARRDSDWPYGRIAYHFQYNAHDHDGGPKTFLGETGNFNGEDIIDIVCRQESTARFISRHLYHFFVKDEGPVPSWYETPPNDQQAIEILAASYFNNDHDISKMLLDLFNSDFFKSPSVWFKKVKSPTELAVGVLRISGECDTPDRVMFSRHQQIGLMGQTLNNPPSVEGWHEGHEWIDTGTLVERINFVSEQFGDEHKPRLTKIIANIKASHEGEMSPTTLVQNCLDHLGFISVEENTLQALNSYADQTEHSANRINGLLRLIGTSKEYQLA
jgi:uncharacterized protein (DUF1800 family)